MYDRDEWLSSYREEIIDPDREIIDPHHHLWAWRSLKPYLLDELWADTMDGHNVSQTVYIECGWGYREDGPEHLKSVGETEFVADIAAQAAKKPDQPQIGAIVSRVDLRHADVDATLEAHETAGNGLFRGVRFMAAFDDEPTLSIPPHAPEGLFQDSAFRRGLHRLGELGFSFEAWQYHHQLRDVRDLARACPETTIVLDHFSTPLGVGKYEGKRDDIFNAWKVDMKDLASCRNVVAKLGGLSMVDNGWGYHLGEKPTSSDQIVADQARYYHHTIDAFGPERCMFESNFPVDRASVSYHVLWNAFKKIANRYSETEKDQLFAGTARRVYKLS